MLDVPEISEGHRYQTEWQNLRLVLEYRSEYWQVYVYDFRNCEVLYTAARLRIDAAQFAVCEFAVLHTFSAKHDLKLEVLAEMLSWKPH